MSCWGGKGTPVGAICHGRGASAGLPPVWLIYLPVGDLHGSLHRVDAEGGRIVKASGSGDRGWAVVQDPVGAYFALVQA